MLNSMLTSGHCDLPFLFLMVSEDDVVSLGFWVAPHEDVKDSTLVSGRELEQVLESEDVAHDDLA